MIRKILCWLGFHSFEHYIDGEVVYISKTANAHLKEIVDFRCYRCGYERKAKS